MKEHLAFAGTRLTVMNGPVEVMGPQLEVMGPPPEIMGLGEGKLTGTAAKVSPDPDTWGQALPREAQISRQAADAVFITFRSWHKRPIVWLAIGGTAAGILGGLLLGRTTKRCAAR